ncbi:DDE_3 domain-containing protein [Trichonephila clavipes]|nr:DDE_3 domain-containing protein [Trichonephila clavipes]
MSRRNRQYEQYTRGHRPQRKLQGVTVSISWDTRSSLVVLQGTLTARRYVDDILTPIVLPMLSSRPGAIYQQMLACSPNNVFKGYDVLPWPARSPDLSPIEHCARDTGELTAQILPQGVIVDATPNFGLYSCQGGFILTDFFLQAVTA